MIPMPTNYSAVTATDNLGRTLITPEQAGPPRANRTVGLFYYLWAGQHGTAGPFNIPQILAANPDAMTRPTSPPWGPPLEYHHWSEPLFGYYQSTDEWVLRRHMQMITEAGVDVLIFDATNNFTYPQVTRKLFPILRELRAQGFAAPAVAYYCNPSDGGFTSLAEAYNQVYEPGLYADLWYHLDGKPLIIADPHSLTPALLRERSRCPRTELLDGRTLGQVFTVDKPLTAVGTRISTWGIPRSSVTLTLYAGKRGGEMVSSQKFEHLEDNGAVLLQFETPLPAGTYYLSLSQPSGRIGWYGYDVLTSDGAWDNGSPADGVRTVLVRYAGQHREQPLFRDPAAMSGEEAAADIAKIHDFFTYRLPTWGTADKAGIWPWMDLSPQTTAFSETTAKEQITISVGLPNVSTSEGWWGEPSMGRSWHDGALDTRPGAVEHGFLFAEQWQRALEEDPEFVFITQFNEWFAMRMDDTFFERKHPVLFRDQFNEEFSRDIEPVKGGFGDNYYLQMVDYIRRYKGVQPSAILAGPFTIALGGPWSQWENVQPAYRGYVGDVEPRNHPGYDGVGPYINRTGRNDFETMKVAWDTNNLYFYARTANFITPSTDSNWMMLFLSSSAQPEAGWEGFQYVVNRKVLDGSTSTLEKSTGGWNWQVKAPVSYRVHADQLHLAIPREALGLKDNVSPVQLEFKWSDNMQAEGDIMDFYSNGDTAPTGRLKFVAIIPPASSSVST